MKKIVSIAVLSIISCNCWAALYSITDLGAFSTDKSSYAKSINNYGQIVGYSYNASGTKYAFLWDTHNGIKYINNDLYDCDSVIDINDSGDIVAHVRSVGMTFGNGKFVYRKHDSSMISINNQELFAPYALNNNGIVVGRLGVLTHSSYKWTNEAGFQSISGIQSDAMQASAVAISDNGYIGGNVGSYGYVLTPNGAYYQVSFDGVSDINNQGQAITGVNKSIIPGFLAQYHCATLWSLATGNIELDVLENTGYRRTESYANAINDEGIIVGYYNDCDNVANSRRACIWLDNNMLDLNSLLDASGEGWKLTSAVDINESGIIVGYGTNPDGISRGFVLTPVPEPTMCGMLLLGVLVISKRRNRRHSRIKLT